MGGTQEEGESKGLHPSKRPRAKKEEATQEKRESNQEWAALRKEDSQEIVVCGEKNKKEKV